MSPAPLIAIVDDDDSAREAAMGLVRALGYDVVGYGSAAEFLADADGGRCACLVTDMRMPVTSGVDLHDQLVARGRRIPTILTTAYPDAGTRERALRAGIGAYLAKPLAPAVLLDAIRKAFGQ